MHVKNITVNVYRTAQINQRRCGKLSRARPIAEIPNYFNKHFLSIAANFSIHSNPSKAIEYLLTHLDSKQPPPCTLPTITKDTIDKCLKNLVNKAPTTQDIYDISVTILQTAWPVISTLLV